MDRTEKKVAIAVTAMVIFIYATLIYTGNFNFSSFLQGFGEGLASMIVVAGITYLIFRMNQNRRKK